MKIKFKDDKQYYPCNGVSVIDFQTVQINGTDLPTKTSGFVITDDEKNSLYYFDSYKYIYDSNDYFVQFTNDDSIYYTYWIANEDNFVVKQETYTEPQEGEQMLFVKSGRGRVYAHPELINFFDETGFSRYKIENNEKKFVSTEDKQAYLDALDQASFAEAMEQKLEELTKACSDIIIAGVTVNDKHYTYTLADQADLSNAVQMATATGMKVPYHADGENCLLYTPEEITEIYFAAEMILTKQTTYHNQLKQYTKTLTTKQDLSAIEYGQPLDDEHLATYNMIVDHSALVLAAIASKEIGGYEND